MLTDRITKEEFLARCAMIYDTGIVNDLWITKDYVEATERFLGFQKDIFQSIIDTQRARQDKRTLANDIHGHNAVKMLYILTNECQICSTNPEGNHRAPAFCPHGDDINNMF